MTEFTPESSIDADASQSGESGGLVDTAVVEGTPTGPQTVSIEHSKLAMKAEADAHKRHLERLRLEHQLEQERKDNDARRDREANDDATRRDREALVFRLVVGGTIVGLAIGAAASFLAANDATQRWGQALVTLIIGGLVGYFTGSKIGK